jgi:hypothetical protein
VELDGSDRYREGREKMCNLIWIIVVVLFVHALLGYFGRGRFRR